MSRDFGEAAWTARDLNEVYLVVDYDEACYGEYATHGEALARRESLIAIGVECWVVGPATRFEEDAC